MIVLGDQAPWTGGMLRWLALRQHQPEKKVAYFIQDGDAPWMQSGGTPKINRGWVKYWSIASRNALALDVPNIALHSVRESLKGPRGLSYISGPKTTRTIFSAESDKSIQEFTGQLLDEEQRWYSKVVEMLGMPCRNIAHSFPGIGPLEVSRQLAGDLALDGDDIRSAVRWFSEEPLVTRNILPPSYFWNIGEDGERHQCTSLNGNSIITPKAAALVIEFAARGHTLGCTSLGYLREVSDIRDMYFPGMKVKILRITFRWTFKDGDPCELLLSEFCKRKKLRGESVPSFNGDISAIRDYWSGRPTVLGWLLLGGEINPSFEEIEI